MASPISPRLWGGMLVAMPTAMPPTPLTSRLGSLAGSTIGSLSEPSKLSMKSTVSLSMSPSISSAMRRQARLGVAHGRGARRRPPSQSCPGRPPAGSAWRSPAPCAPWPRRRRSRRGGGTCPAPRRRCGRSCGGLVVAQAHLVHGVEDAALHRLEAVAHVGQGARGDDAHGVVQIRRAHRLVDIDVFYGADFHPLLKPLDDKDTRLAATRSGPSPREPPRCAPRSGR